MIIEKISNNNSEKQKAQAIFEIEKNIPLAPIKETTLFFLGDMMFDRGVKNSVKNNFNGDFNKLFEKISEIKNADILFANLEGPASDDGSDIGNKYSFKMNPITIDALKNASIDIVSFSNNHSGDWGLGAFEDTLSRLDNAGILHGGSDSNKINAENPTIIEKNGIRFGFLSFSDIGPNWLEAKENSPGILLAGDPRLSDIIKKAKNKSDVLIISFHWGEEYQKIHNSRQEKLAKISIDNGADIVVGHHPHVIQDIDNYNGKPIAYSLGNLIFDQSFSKETMRGMLFSVTFNGKELKKIESKIITLNKKFQPEGIFNEEQLKEKDELASSSCSKPKKEYDDMSLLAIGQDIELPDTTYIPKDLREINSEYSTKDDICLTKEARDSFEIMAKKAKIDGYIIKTSSGFRSYGIQKYLLETAIKNGNENANIAIAKEGHSEHQLGNTVDITGKSIDYIGASSNFDQTDESKWLENHASDYGFIQSYPLGKEKITGYMYEPWHYRYVGIDNAKEIIKSGQTINEFLNKI